MPAAGTNENEQAILGLRAPNGLLVEGWNAFGYPRPAPWGHSGRSVLFVETTTRCGKRSGATIAARKYFRGTRMFRLRRTRAGEQRQRRLAAHDTSVAIFRETSTASPRHTTLPL
jgi:hypothetical protein